MLSTIAKQAARQIGPALASAMAKELNNNNQTIQSNFSNLAPSFQTSFSQHPGIIQNAEILGLSNMLNISSGGGGDTGGGDTSGGDTSGGDTSGNAEVNVATLKKLYDTTNDAIDAYNQAVGDVDGKITVGDLRELASINVSSQIQQLKSAKTKLQNGYSKYKNSTSVADANKAYDDILSGINDIAQAVIPFGGYIALFKKASAAFSGLDQNVEQRRAAAHADLVSVRNQLVNDKMEHQDAKELEAYLEDKIAKSSKFQTTLESMLKFAGLIEQTNVDALNSELESSKSTISDLESRIKQAQGVIEDKSSDENATELDVIADNIKAAYDEHFAPIENDLRDAFESGDWSKLADAAQKAANITIDDIVVFDPARG
jgi:predicted  nucleic acid-binding Zn-ribbon protein